MDATVKTSPNLSGVYQDNLHLCLHLDGGHIVENVHVFHPLDQSFLENAAGALVSGATLPSGYKVPSGKDGKEWIVVSSNKIELKKSDFKNDL